MNLPPTYRHDYAYEPPRPAPVYDTPRIVERRPLFAWFRLVSRRARPVGAPAPLEPLAVREAHRASLGNERRDELAWRDVESGIRHRRA